MDDLIWHFFLFIYCGRRSPLFSFILAFSLLSLFFYIRFLFIFFLSYYDTFTFYFLHHQGTVLYECCPTCLPSAQPAHPSLAR